MKKITLKTWSILIVIAFIVIEKSLHNHFEVFSDDINIRWEKIHGTYYGEAIGIEALKQNLSESNENTL